MGIVKCDHCHLEYDDSVMIKEVIDETSHNFCCKGCQGVYHLLQDEGLDNFYDRVGSTTLHPPSSSLSSSAKFDSPTFLEQYTIKRNEAVEVSLVIEGIHCSACVWLNEKVLHQKNGIVDVAINFSTNKAKIIYDPKVVKLSEVIDTIRSIGYDAHAYDPKLQESYANKERKDYYMRMAVAIFATMNIMWVAVAQYGGYFTGMRQDIKTILNVAEWILATPVLFYSGWIFFRGAFYGIKNRIVNMDILVATGALLTYLYSIYITLNESGEAYFDSVTMIITFVLIGKFLEVLSKKSAADTLDMMSRYMPLEASVVEGDVVKTISVHEIKVGDIVELKSGERAALDGEVLRGEGGFDESNLTGESTPVYKSIGQKIIGGTLYLDGLLRYRVVKDYAHSTISHLVSLLESALEKKPKIEQLANELSRHFSTAILLLSIFTFFAWWLWPHDFERAFLVGISVIVIACPCALALATPLATLVGLGIGTKRGILFKEAAFLETIAKADMVILDKTGTITEGRPKVVKAEVSSEHVADIYALVKASFHPIAQGVAGYLEAKFSNIEILTLERVRVIQARGVEAYTKNGHLLGGSASLMDDVGLSIKNSFEGSGFYFAINSEVVAEFELYDTPKDGAKELVTAMKREQISVVMLTGDHRRAAKRVADEVGIDTLHHSLLPQQKAEYIKRAQESGHIVVMVGDGVNDILALASADIAIAMGSGADVAIDVSDVVLLNDSLKSLREAFSISSTTFALVKQNLTLSLVYNAITIPLAMAGYIIPLIAALSMSFSSLLVVANSMRIKQQWKKR